MDDAIVKELRLMPRSELIKMAGEFKPPVKLPRTFSNLQAARMIRKRQLADAPPETPAQITEPPKADNDEFLKVTDPTPEPPPVEEKKDGRGGARPGAGRPLGMTADKAAVFNLPQVANPSIVAALRMAFAAWSAAVKIEEIALTESEAIEIALPYTQLLEFYFPGEIPEIAWTWIMAAWSTFNIFFGRIKIIKAAREAKPKEETPKP